MKMVGSQPFCDDHWKELVPRIKTGEVNGIALQPLALEALLAHEDIHDDYDPDGEGDIDVAFVFDDVNHICCYLEGRTRYTDDSDRFDDDYAVLVHLGTLPDEMPDEWWGEGK